jgi:hypothetical protein
MKASQIADLIETDPTRERPPVPDQAVRALISALAVAVFLAGADRPARAQAPTARFGEVIPRDVREMYDRGLHFLATTQSERGDWPNQGGEQGPGCTGMGLMVFLACGEDPNFGPYTNHIRRALRSIIESQDASTGIMGMSMYHHGFAMLALAEAYGTVDDRNLWPDKKGPRSIGGALELAVRAALTAQKRSRLGAWRYSPSAADADTSVSGAVLVGLLAARNAGIEVPDEAINKAIGFYTSMTSAGGEVGYAGGMGGFGDSLARSSIATLVYAVARRKDLKQYKAAVEYLRQRVDQVPQQWPEYTRYYQAQALFQGDVAAWERWNKTLVRQLKATQSPDGSFHGQLGPSVSTALGLLAIAVNYRFLPIYER